MTQSDFEKMGGTYRKVGDYFIPKLTLPPEDDTRPIGIWGRRHRDFLKQNKKSTYAIMQMDGSLHSYLADINEQAEEMLFRLVKEMAQAERITEQLKTENQMEWVGRMNNIRNRAIEIINAELIYV